MDILHICVYYRNPMFRFLIGEQIKKSIQLRVFYYERRKIGLKAFDEPYIDIQPSNNRFLVSPLFYFKRLKLVKKSMMERYRNIRFDCIHAHTLFSDGYLAHEAYKMWGIPYVITVRSCDMNHWYLWRIPQFRAHGLNILKDASFVTFLSPSYRDLLLARLPYELAEEVKLKSFIIPNGVDDYWHSNRLKYSKVNDTNVIRLLTVGKIDKRKNQSTVAKAANKLINDGYQVNYTVVGKIISKSIGRNLKKKSFIKVCPNVSKEELISFYKESDILVMPSRQETFGLVYAEAMTQGLPVIYTKGQGFDEQFSDGEVGYSVNDSSFMDIADAIIKITDNYSPISSRCIISSHKFNWSSVAEEYKNVYLKTK